MDTRMHNACDDGVCVACHDDEMHRMRAGRAHTPHPIYSDLCAAGFADVADELAVLRTFHIAWVMAQIDPSELRLNVLAARAVDVQ